MSAPRMEGKPEATGNTSFTDVPANMYYAPAIAWASANGVVYGTSETAFSPEGKITREQLQKIAELKMPDLNAANIDTAISMIAGTARSMGVEVEG